MSEFGEVDQAEISKLKERKSLSESRGRSSLTEMASVPEVEAPIKREFDDFLTIAGLPSKNLFYDNNITGQALVVDDCLLLNSVNADNSFERFTDIFSRRILGINPYQILKCDEIYLALWLRYTAYPNKAFPGLKYNCTSCKEHIGYEESQFYFDELTIDVPDLDEMWAKYSQHNGRMLITLPESKEEVLIEPRRRGHQFRVNKYIKMNFGKKVPSDIDKFKLNIGVLIDTTDDLTSVITWMSQLSNTDFAYLSSEVDNNSITADIPVIKTKCPMCQEVTPIPGYIFRGSIYLPKS